MPSLVDGDLVDLSLEIWLDEFKVLPVGTFNLLSGESVSVVTNIKFYLVPLVVDTEILNVRFDRNKFFNLIFRC